MKRLVNVILMSAVLALLIVAFNQANDESSPQVAEAGEVLKAGDPVLADSDESDNTSSDGDAESTVTADENVSDTRVEDDPSLRVVSSQDVPNASSLIDSKPSNPIVEEEESSESAVSGTDPSTSEATAGDDDDDGVERVASESAIQDSSKEPLESASNVEADDARRAILTTLEALTASLAPSDAETDSTASPEPNQVDQPETEVSAAEVSAAEIRPAAKPDETQTAQIEVTGEPQNEQSETEPETTEDVVNNDSPLTADAHQGNNNVESQPAKSNDLLDQLGIAMRPGRDSITVGNVKLDSPAQTAGIRPGDTIISVNREPVFDTAGFKKAVGEIDAGKPFKVFVVRGEKWRSFKVAIPAPAGDDN